MIRMLYPDFNELVKLKNRKTRWAFSSRRAVKSTIPGNHHSPFRGQGLEFDSVREYVYGDDIRSIDWRVTARTGSPHLKLFKEEHERHTAICIDMNAAMRFGTRKTFKSVQAAKIAACLGWKSLANHHCLGGCLFGDVPGGILNFPPKRTEDSFCRLLKVVSKPLVDRHQVPLNKALQQLFRSSHTGSLIFVLSDFMDLGENLLHDASLSQLKQRCDVVFISINDPADWSIPPLGYLKFCTSEGEKIGINTDSLSGRDAYAKLWKENREKLYQITSKFKIALFEVSTESNPWDKI